MTLNHESSSKTITYWITALSNLFSHLEQVSKQRASLNLTQSLILISLSDSKRKTRVGDIAKLLDLRANTTTAALSKLRSRDFIIKSKEQSDRRFSFISLTDKGIDTKHILHREFIHYIDEFIFSYLSDEREYFTHLIQNHDSFPALEQGLDDVSFDTIIIFFIRRLYLEFTYFLRSHDLNIIETRILLASVASTPSETLSMLGKRLNVRQNSLSIGVSELEKKNLITKVISNADNRAALLKLTDKGVELSHFLIEEIHGYSIRIGFDTKRASQIAEKLVAASNNIDRVY